MRLVEYFRTSFRNMGGRAPPGEMVDYRAVRISFCPPVGITVCIVDLTLALPSSFLTFSVNLGVYYGQLV